MSFYSADRRNRVAAHKRDLAGNGRGYGRMVAHSETTLAHCVFFSDCGMLETARITALTGKVLTV